MSDLQAAYLWAQLEAAERINQQRPALWQNYYDALLPLARRIELPTVPADCGQTRTCSTLSCVISRIAAD